MSRYVNANDKPAERLGKYDRMIGVDDDKMVSLNERMLTRGAAYRIVSELVDAKEKGYRITVVLSNRKTVRRLGTAQVRMPNSYYTRKTKVNGVSVYRTVEAKIILYRWSEMVLLHELAHIVQHMEKGQFGGHRFGFRNTMRRLVEKRLEAIGKKLVVRTGKTKEELVLEALRKFSMDTNELARVADTTNKSVQSIICRLRKMGNDIVRLDGRYTMGYSELGLMMAMGA